MNILLNAMPRSVKQFVREESGAQVIEYALIVAVVSLVLVLSLKGLTDTDGGFTKLISRVTLCLNGGTCA